MRFAIAAVMLLLAFSSKAEVFKCEQAGKVVYADQPCAANTVGRLAVHTTSPNGQTQASMTSEERVAHEKKQLDKLTQSRLKKEEAEAREARKSKPKKEKTAKRSKKKKTVSKKPKKIRVKTVSKKTSE